MNFNIKLADILKTALAVAERRIDTGAKLEYTMQTAEIGSKCCTIINFKIYLYDDTETKQLTETTEDI